MRSALPPHLRICCAPSRLWRLGVWLLCALVPGLLAIWCSQHWASDDGSVRIARTGLAVMALLLALSALKNHFRPEPLRLEWDGLHWHASIGSSGAALAGTMQPMIDLNRWMLLRLRPAPTVSGSSRQLRSSQWIALAADDVGAQWHPLRCLLQSPAPEDKAALASSTP